MSPKRANPKAEEARPERPIPQAVDVHAGVPDCAAKRPAWRWVAMILLFAAWISFLMYCWLGGNSPK